MKILAVDIGGTNVKLLATGRRDKVSFPSGPNLTPKRMIDGIRAAIPGWKFDVVSLGYPGPVLDNHPVADPHNLGPGWVNFDYAAEFGCEVKIINDAAMQALGSYEGGRMLFLGLGTGLGSAMVVEHLVLPMELAHLPYRKGRTYEEHLGIAGLKRAGKKKWRHYVDDVVCRLKAALLADYVVLGGGNSKQLKELPHGARLGDNANAFRGGFRLWKGHQKSPFNPTGASRVPIPHQR